MRVLAVAVLLIGLWQVLVSVTNVPTFILPGPLSVMRATYENAPLLGLHALYTAAEILLGLLFGALLGIFCAVGMSMSEFVTRSLRPLLSFSQAIPVFALAPILTLWIGYGMASKIVVVVLIVFFPIASAFYDGLQATPESSLDLARLARARRWPTFFWLRLPHALPSLGASLRIAAVYAPIGAVTGEWVGASHGLGYLMLLANGRMKTDLMFAAVCVLTLLTIALRSLVGWSLKKIQL